MNVTCPSPNCWFLSLIILALALDCYRCIPGLSGTCADTQTDCSDQCASMTTVMNADGLEHVRRWKACAAAEQCVAGSLNLGVVNVAINSICCSTAFCNSQKVPALPQQPANGMKCYTCAENGCTETMSCKGDEDRCISATVIADGVQTTMKGCVSRSLCTAEARSMQTAGVTGSVNCCEGDLCNSAEGGDGLVVKCRPVRIIGKLPWRECQHGENLGPLATCGELVEMVCDNLALKAFL
ncbi:hypothetical protein AOLI_G00154900 [Acnodon oligacanthus]